MRPIARCAPKGPSDAAIVLSEGAMLVLYTDGLTESTRNLFEGEQRLREALARADVRDSATPAAAIRRAVFGKASDDVAILTVQRSRVGPA
jgi:serine phosphatase RsbU (regulator of sigma subunit)